MFEVSFDFTRLSDRVLIALGNSFTAAEGLGAFSAITRAVVQEQEGRKQGHRGIGQIELPALDRIEAAQAAHAIVAAGAQLEYYLDRELAPTSALRKEFEPALDMLAETARVLLDQIVALHAVAN